MTHTPARTLKIAALTLLIAASATLGGCYLDSKAYRNETAKRLATPSFMMERQIQAGQFTLQAYERVYDRGAPAIVYIEGDGMAQISKMDALGDPTPMNPVALHIATRDLSRNVIYVGLPCQYVDQPQKNCGEKYWKEARFSPEVIAAMDEALNNMKRRWGISSFDLVGFSGGAAIAVLVAANRDDITSIRTVAGTLDTDLFYRMHDLEPLAESLNPVDVAAKVAHIPQHHFRAEWDDIIPPHLYESYRQAAGDTKCVRGGTVLETEHEKGWVNKWPELLKAPLDCENR